MVGDRRGAVGGNVLLPPNLEVQSESSACLTKVQDAVASSMSFRKVVSVLRETTYSRGQVRILPSSTIHTEKANTTSAMQIYPRHMGLKWGPNQHNYNGRRGTTFCLVGVFAGAVTSSPRFASPSLHWSRMQ